MPRMNDTQELYDNIYKNGPKVRFYDRYWKYAEAVKNVRNPLDYLAKSEETYWGVRSALLNIQKERKLTKILEVGSGLGYLTYGLRMAGYDSYGLDISENAVAQAKTDFGSNYIASDIFDYAEQKAACFDVVILTEVIEHIDNPLPFLRALMKLIIPTGQIILTTPNKSLYPDSVIWASDLPPVHCWWFSEESIEYISDKINASLSFIDFSEYYRSNGKLVDPYDLAKPAFDKDGELIIYERPKNSTLFIITLKGFFRNISLFRKFNFYLRAHLNKELIVCNKKGLVICAILKKKGK